MAAPQVQSSREPRLRHNCGAVPLDNERPEDDPTVLRPKAEGRLFTCLGGDYGPDDYKWCGINPRLGLRWASLDPRQKEIYKKLAPDHEHEEAAIVLLEQAKEKGLESLKTEVFKGVMIHKGPGDSWVLASRTCTKPADTYSHQKDHLLSSMHAPIKHPCPFPQCGQEIGLTHDLRRHLKDVHNFSGTREQLMNALKPQPSAPANFNVYNNQSVTVGSINIGNQNTIQPPQISHHGSLHPQRAPRQTARTAPYPPNNSGHRQHVHPSHPPNGPPFAQNRPAPNWVQQPGLLAYGVVQPVYTQLDGTAPHFTAVTTNDYANFGDIPHEKDQFDTISGDILPRCGDRRHPGGALSSLRGVLSPLTCLRTNQAEPLIVLVSVSLSLIIWYIATTM